MKLVSLEIKTTSSFVCPPDLDSAPDSRWLCLGFLYVKWGDNDLTQAIQQINPPGGVRHVEALMH